MNTPAWAIVYHTNSNNPRARKWYHVARVIEADGKLFELYWHDDVNLRSDNRALIRTTARQRDVALLPGVFTHAPSPCRGSELVDSFELLYRRMNCCPYHRSGGDKTLSCGGDRT